MASIDLLPEDLWDEIGSTLVENEDIVPIAAACLCAGGPVLTFLGRKLYLLASPHLNEETHLGDHCTISDLKEVLTELKLPASGTKPQLIKRIFEETHPVSIRCPASRACRNNVLVARNEPRIVIKQVFKQFNVSVYGSDKLSSVTMMDEIKGKMVTTYLVEEVRALARRKFGSLENMIESKVLRRSFVYCTSKLKYKQEIELEEKTYLLAMESLVRRAKVAIDQIVHDLPRIVHAMARKVWDRNNTV